MIPDVNQSWRHSSSSVSLGMYIFSTQSNRDHQKKPVLYVNGISKIFSHSYNQLSLSFNNATTITQLSRSRDLLRSTLSAEISFSIPSKSIRRTSSNEKEAKKLVFVHSFSFLHLIRINLHSAFVVVVVVGECQRVKTISYHHLLTHTNSPQ